MRITPVVWGFLGAKSAERRGVASRKAWRRATRVSPMSTSQLEPYLCFNGTCEEAMAFYQSVLGGDLEISRFGQYGPPDMPEEQANKVMHSSLRNGGLSFMASDAPPGQTIAAGESISMSLAGTDAAELSGFFEGLSEGGTVTLPLDKQMWGDTFGMVQDRFGINWMVNISEAS